MTALTSVTKELWESGAAPQVVIVEATSGPARRSWLEDLLREMGESGARTFSVSCDFDSAGPWGGVNELFSVLVAEIQTQRPDLVERHAPELVYILPQLRRSLTVRNSNLTDLSPSHERTRNYPVDRAFRNVHGLIDLLDSWKTAACVDTPWVIACDSYDTAGPMSRAFFKELLRRRGQKLHLQLLVAVELSKAEEARASLIGSGPAEVVSVNLTSDPQTKVEPGQAARMALELEERIGEDEAEMQVALPDLIRLWRFAGRGDRLLQYKYLGLEIYNTLGLYNDALRYGNDILALAAEHAPDNDLLRWTILLKLLGCHMALQDVQTSLKLASEEGLKLLEQHADWGTQLFYLIAMINARFQKPRDFVKGEEYLERALAVIEKADIEESEHHFQFAFNRNGLAMIRTFQGRHQDAIELCRTGIARLNANLTAEKHRLHRSILVYNIAQVYAATSFYAEAIEYYSATIAMDPNYSEYYNERGSILLHLDRLEEAHADYLKAIELSPPYFEVFTNLGQCYRRMGAMEDAIEAYSRALDLSPGQVLALLGRAKAHEELGHIQAAVADYTAALDLESTLWEAVASRGVMYYEAGNLETSLADFNRAIELKPDGVDLYQNRATVLADLGRYGDAACDLNAALMLNPSDADKLAIQAKLEAALQAVA